MQNWQDWLTLLTMLGVLKVALQKRRTLPEGKRRLLLLNAIVILLGMTLALSGRFAPSGSEWLSTILALVGAITIVLLALLILTSFLFWLNGDLEQG